MSRWIEQFENHPFQAVWTNLKNSLSEAKVDDETVITSVQELARLKKVVSYIDEMINSLDPELVPLSTWDNFNSQATPCYQQIINFNNNRNFGHITNANANADNLISYIRPYMIAEGKAGKVLHDSLKEYAKTVEEFIGSFHEKSSSALSSINDDKKVIEALKTNIESVDGLVSRFKEKLFSIEPSEEGIEFQIDALVEDIETKHEEIVALHDVVLVGDEKNPSVKKIITDAKSKAIEDQKSIEDLLNSITDEVKELEGFYVKIFGKLSDDEERVGGLSNELVLRMKTLREFEEKQLTKYEALVGQIETLLPGATSAGLATAYRQMKRSFDKPIRNVEYVFYAAIALLVITSLFTAIDSAGWFWLKIAKFENWDAAIKALLNKLPLYGAVIWLALFASKRRSEYQRLQQEYAHKEALAKSYNSYKKQIESLDDEDQSMQKDLIQKAVDAISFNASQTLDGKHGDNHPLHEIVNTVLENIKLKDVAK